MKTTPLLFIFLALVLSCKPKVDKDSAEALLEFIPKNYSLLDTTRGDLNQDGLTDLIMVLNQTNEADSSDINSDPIKRRMLILINKNNKKYELTKQNDNAVYCYACGGMLGDPYQNITIKNGSFSIEHFGGSSWRWARTSTFSYQDKDWYLTEDALVSSHASDPEKIDAKTRTQKDFGKVKFEDFDIYKE